MRKLGLLCLPLALVFAATARPQPAASPAGPVVKVRIRSLDSLAGGVRFICEVTGGQEAAKRFDTFLRQKLSAKEFQGIDTERSLGLYVLNDQAKKLRNADTVFVVPISNEQAFLKTLERHGLKATKGKGGLYTMKGSARQEGRPLYFRFAHHYAYFTNGPESVLANDHLLAPAQLFPAAQKAGIRVDVRLDRLPEQTRQNLLHHLSRAAKATREPEQVGETAAQRELRSRVAGETRRILMAALRDGKDLSAEIDVNSAHKELRVELTLTPQAHTRLAQGIANLEKMNTKFPGLLTAHTVAGEEIHLTLPEKLQTPLSKAIEEAARKARIELKGTQEKERLAKLFAALAPSIDTGHLDSAYSVRGPDASGHYTLVAGVRLKEQASGKQNAEDLLRSLPAVTKVQVKRGEEKPETVCIHRIDVQKALDAKVRKFFGDGPLFVAARHDAVFVALGGHGLKAIETAVTTPAGKAAPLRYEVSLRRLALALAKKDQREQVEKLFPAGAESRIEFTIKGGKALRLCYRIGLDTLHWVEWMNPNSAEPDAIRRATPELPEKR